jgi:hypothetical protein
LNHASSRRRAVLSLATGDGRYPLQLARLRRSIEASGFTGELAFWPPGSMPDGCPPQNESPFAFKPFVFADAARNGVDLALWLDASAVVVRPLDELFAEIEAQGYLLFANGRHRVGAWASDLALAELDVGRDEAMGMPEVNAAAIGLDLGHPVARRFLATWLEEARKGVAFRGVAEPIRSGADYFDVKWNHRGRVSSDPRVRGHRHDQTVAGIIAAREGLRLTARWLESSTGGLPTGADTIVLIDRDGARSPAARAVAGFVRRHPSLAALVRRVRRSLA